MAEDSSLSQEEIDALLGMGGDDAPASTGGGDSGDAGSSGGFSGSEMGLDQASLDALAGAVAGPSPSMAQAPVQSSGGPKRQVGESRDNASLLMDVNLRFTVELGRTQMYIKDVLMLDEGSIVELDKNVGDEVDILINDRFFGRGKLVVMDDFFGVQITYVQNPLARIA
jgi:flagellar motor switch protein FliN/FliY